MPTQKSPKSKPAKAAPKPAAKAKGKPAAKGDDGAAARIAEMEKAVRELSSKHAEDLAARDGELTQLRADLERASSIVKTDAEALAARQSEIDDLKRHLRCPKCGGQMHEEAYEVVTIDKCGNCGGVYFDKGELEQVRENLEAAMTGGGGGGWLKRLFGGA